MQAEKICVGEYWNSKIFNAVFTLLKFGVAKMRWFWPLLAIFGVLSFSAFAVVFFSTVVSIQTMTAVWRSITLAPPPPPPSPTPFMMVETGFMVFVAVIVLAALMAFTVFMASRPPSREMVGAIALTLAAVILISGVWCMALSPTTEYMQFKDRYDYSLSIRGLESKSVTFTAEKGETLDISVGLTVRIMRGEAFNVYVLDPEDELIWQDLNVTDSYFRTEALKSGAYKVEVKNLSINTITCPISISRTLRVTVRPLEPAGQWLSLISLPIFGLGIWASGIHTTVRKRISARI